MRARGGRHHDRTAARQERARAHEAYDRASHGLADLQAGIDELVRRAHGHRQLVRRLDDARRLLARPALSPGDAADALAELDRERARLETDLSRIERDGRDLEARRADHGAALRALVTIDPTFVLDADVHARARALLARLADRETARDRLQELERERVEAVQLATRQAHARALATALALSEDVVTALAATEQQLRSLELAEETRRADARARAQAAHEVRGRLAARRRSQRALAPRADRGSPAARRVRPAHESCEVTAQRDRILRSCTRSPERTRQLEAHRQALQERAQIVEQSGTNLDPSCCACATSSAASCSRAGSRISRCRGGELGRGAPRAAHRRPDRRRPRGRGRRHAREPATRADGVARQGRNGARRRAARGPR